MSQIFPIAGDSGTHLSVVLCPQASPELERELRAFKQAGIETLVSLLETDEAAWLGLEDESSVALRLGIRFQSFPIADAHTPPDPAAFRSFVAGLADRLRAGERIAVHCRGSIGRATVTAACTLIHLGWSPFTALAAVQEARGCPVPDTFEQQRWILNYKVEQ